MENITDQEKVRREKLEKLKEMNIDIYPDKFDFDNYSLKLIEEYDKYSKEELKEMEVSVSVAGRIMTKRGAGKAAFMHLQDNLGLIQIYLRKDELEDEFLVFEQSDIGDIAGISGILMKTNTGELTIRAKSYTHLSKALKPLPEKYHGLADDEIKLRKRYLDIITDNEVKDMFRKKQIFWQTIRNILIEKDFLEVETPTLETIAGGAAATPFKTHHNALDLDVYLRISMGELWQKKLLVAGYDKTFEIGRQFRNEGMSPEHLQDYTQMEFYWAYANYKDGMQLVKEMYRAVTKNVLGTSKFSYKEYDVDMDDEWTIYDFETVVEEHTGINVFDSNEKEVKNKLNELNQDYEDDISYWRLVDILWKTVRRKLSGPGFLTGQPAELNPLPKRSKEDPRKVEQFQVIIAGSEVGNGYSELNDPEDLKERFIEQMAMKEDGDEEAHSHDEDFIEALLYGMPPAVGFGISERFFSFLMNRPIRECVVFPLMRPKD